MENDALPEDWNILLNWLPQDLDELARKHGFLRRARGLQDSHRWLRLILMHVGGGLSLKQTVERGSELNIAEVSSVALFKRLRSAERWLQQLTAYLLSEHRRRMGLRIGRGKGAVRVIDATDVHEPGDTGSSWRVHYSLRLPEMICDHYELTDDHGGEKLGRFVFKPGELVLVDRGYSHRAGVAHVLQADADVVVRWNHSGFPLSEINGGDFKVLPKGRRLKIGEVAEWPVEFEHDGTKYPLRLCARRKGRLAAERARRKKLRKARCNKTGTDADSLELTEYILVLTSLSETSLSTEEVLNLYRCRWQVELTFKRLKSLLGMGHVPKSNDASAKAWMQAKILISLLIERTLLEARFFSPWGDAR